MSSQRLNVHGNYSQLKSTVKIKICKEELNLHYKSEKHNQQIGVYSLVKTFQRINSSSNTWENSIIMQNSKIVLRKMMEFFFTFHGIMVYNSISGDGREDNNTNSESHCDADDEVESGRLTNREAEEFRDSLFIGEKEPLMSGRHFILLMCKMNIY